MEGAVDNGTTPVASLNARDFRLELVKRLAPAFWRPFEHRLRLSRVGECVGLHHLHQRAARGGAELDLREGAEQRSAAARVNHVMIDRQAVWGHNLGELPLGPVVDALWRAHADLKRASRL